MMKTKLSIKMKSGEIVPANSPVVACPASACASYCLVQGARIEPYKVRWSSAFKEPNLKTLEKYVYDGIAKSVGGKQVEPDGWDSDGSPSWLLALNLI